jgi:hypothetical protein
MYTPPELWELGTVSSFTLGSNHTSSVSGTKANNTTTDLFTAFTGSKGVPCNVGPNVGQCNTP